MRAQAGCVHTQWTRSSFELVVTPHFEFLRRHRITSLILKLAVVHRSERHGLHALGGFPSCARICPVRRRGGVYVMSYVR